jgi:hypothetical protein
MVKKKIPNTIGQWLTPVGLAFWGMDNDSSTLEGFYLNTHSYSYKE